MIVSQQPGIAPPRVASHLEGEDPRGGRDLKRSDTKQAPLKITSPPGANHARNLPLLPLCLRGILALLSHGAAVSRALLGRLFFAILPISLSSYISTSAGIPVDARTDRPRAQLSEMKGSLRDSKEETCDCRQDATCWRFSLLRN